MGKWLASLVCIGFSCYCLLWCLLSSGYPADRRWGGAFVGVLLLLLAWFYVRQAPAEGPQESQALP